LRLIFSRGLEERDACYFVGARIGDHGRGHGKQRPWRKAARSDRRDQQLLAAAGVHRALSQGLAACGGRGQCERRHQWQKLVVISKDDGGKPADAQTAANELVSSENVAMLTGTFLSNIGLAVSDFANQKKVFFLAAEPLTDAITLVEGQPL